MTGKTTAIEVRRQGEKLVMRAIGRSAKGTKYIVKEIEMATLPGTLKPDPSKVAAEIAEVTGRAVI